jgi:predicted dehydrogenase
MNKALARGRRIVFGNDSAIESRQAETNNKRVISVGVVGCGYWGAKHVRVLSGIDYVKEVVVIDSNRERREAMLAAFPAARAFEHLDSALPYVDALIIAVPPRHHAAVAVEAIRSGKHVLVEKPLTTSIADARLLIREAQQANTVLMVGHTFAFNPAVRELRTRMNRGDLGDIYYLQSARLNLGLYRSDVNVVWDLAPHDISIFNYLLGSVPTSVSAWSSSHAAGEVEDVAMVRLEYEERGVTGYIHVSWLEPKKVRRVTVVGSEKMAVYNDMVEECLRIFDRGVERPNGGLRQFERPISYRYGDIISPHIPVQEPLGIEDRHFINCIQSGTTPQTDGWDGLSVVAVLDAIDQSIRSGGPAKVSMPFDLKPAEPERRVAPVV